MSDLYLKSGATFSDCGQYRYHLWRQWNEEAFVMAFIMLNPSTADANEDDPTIRRCIGFAKREGAGSISVRNVFSLRATDPKELAKHADPVGPNNYYWLTGRVVPLSKIVVAWGAMIKNPRLRDGYLIARAAVRCAAYCLGTTKSGDPRHPLYLPANAPLISWKPV